MIQSYEEELPVFQENSKYQDDIFIHIIKPIPSKAESCGEQDGA